MKIWALISQKGGAGKTSLATQLGVHATQVGEKVIILDMDTQDSSVGWSETRGAGIMPVVIVCLPGKLESALKAIVDSGAFTMVLIDTAPHTNKTAVEAIRAADTVICPARPSMLDLRSFADTAELLSLADAKDKSIGVVNCVHPGNGSAKAYESAASRIEATGIRVARRYVSERVAFVHATDAGKGVTEIAPKSEAAREIIELWGELNGIAVGMPAKAEKEST